MEMSQMKNGGCYEVRHRIRNSLVGQQHPVYVLGIPSGTRGRLQHEGVVVRTVDYDKDKNIGVSFKVKNMGYQERGLGKIHQDCVDYKNSHK